MLTKEFMYEKMEERMPGCNILEFFISPNFKSGSLKVHTENGDKVFMFNEQGILAEQG